MMMQKVEFSFGWLALKLLGKSLYSNAWSAISELVANGFDANAKNIYIYININSLDLTVEVIESIKKYIIEVNNLDKSEKIIILNIIELKR